MQLMPAPATPGAPSQAPAAAPSGKAAPLKPTPVTPPGEEAVLGHLLAFEGAKGAMQFDRADKDVVVTKLTLPGERLSKPTEACQVDIVGRPPVVAAAAGHPEGALRWRVAVEACPFSVDVLDGAALVSSAQPSCDFVAADCRVNPVGLWGPPGATILPARIKELERERVRAETTMRANFPRPGAARRQGPRRRQGAGGGTGRLFLAAGDDLPRLCPRDGARVLQRPDHPGALAGAARETAGRAGQGPASPPGGGSRASSAARAARADAAPAGGGEAMTPVIPIPVTLTPVTLTRVSLLAPTARRLVAAALLAAVPLAPAGAQVPVVSPQYGEPPQPTSLTVRLLAVARPTAAFLQRASRLALERTQARRLHAFARGEAAEQAGAEAALAAAAAPTLVALDPLNVAAVGAASVDETAETILSGLPRLLRTPGARAVAADRAIALAGQDDLRRLAALDAGAFDALYLATQAEGLRRLEAAYRDYVQNGDEPALRAFTVHELPRVRARLAALPKSRS